MTQVSSYRWAMPENPALALPGRRRKQRQAVWPAVSIVILVVFAVIFQPIILTALNLYLLLLALIVWAFSGEPFDRNLLRAVAPFAIVILVGLVIGVHADRYLYLKDAWYVANPALILAVGYVFYRCKPDVGRGLGAFVIAGTLVSLIFLVRLAMHPEALGQEASSLREIVGTGYYASSLSFIILCAYRNRWRAALHLPRWLGGSCFLICTLAIVASFSRTMTIVAVLGILAGFGAFARREWLRFGMVLLVGLLVIVALRINIDLGSRDIQRSFAGKVARSTDEMLIRNYMAQKLINENWRGFEAARALQKYANGNPTQWLFGFGFGAQVDLGFTIRLGGKPMRFIPIFHNGYIYLLIKGGALAVLLYLFSLSWLYVAGRRAASADDRNRSDPGRLLQAVALSLAFTTWVIGGAFNKLDLFPFLLVAGFLLPALTRPGTPKP